MRRLTLARVFPLLAGLSIGSWACQPDPDLTTGWRFAIGRPDEHLVADLHRMPPLDAAVSLPHRLQTPDTALWYGREIELPSGGALEVDADDGAQVFVEGRQLARERRWFFVPEELAGRREVVVRVLNNAMAGGLRRVVTVGPDQVPHESGSGGEIIPAPGFEPVESATFRGRMPRPQETCRFALWADSQGEWETFSRLLTLMASEPLAFSAGIGDLTADGSDPDAWPLFTRALGDLAARTAIVPIVGNHDYDGYYNDLRPELYLRWFRAGVGPTWYAWSCGPVRLLAIDVNAEFPIGISPGTPQHRWLMQQVGSPEWIDARWRLLLVHQPPWSRSWAGYDGDEAVRRIVEPLARDHGLDLVVSGHSHAYERSTRDIAGRCLHLLIVGGAGGSLEDAAAEALGTPSAPIVVRHHFVRATAAGDTLHLEAVDLSGRGFDEVTLRQ